jgi:uncharacterized protein with GYD domain
MPKYLLEVTYTAEGAKGVLKDGGTKRQEAAKKLIKSLGGTLDGLYFAFGHADVIAIVDLPDSSAAAAASLAIGASGGATSRTTVLIPVEDIDQARKRAPKYRAPGH